MFTSTTTAALVALSLLPQAFATVFMTSPTATTVCHGGATCTIAWMEDKANTPPLLADWGTASIGVWVGSQQQQTELQRIQDGVNVATTGQVDFVPNPAMGPNSPVYFIRFTSDATKDPANPIAPAESFSAKFALDNMSGQFNATVQAQINGATGAAPGATSAGPPSSSAPSSASVTSKPSSAASSGTAAKSSTSAKPTGSSAAMALNLHAVGYAAGPLAALFALFL